MTSHPVDAKSIILAQLQPDETIRWTGQPTFLALFLHNWMSIFFGFIFVAIGSVPLLQWLVDEKRPSEDGSTALGSLLFVLVGIGTAGKAIIEAAAAPWTAYAITDRQVLVASWLFRKRVLPFGPNAINAIEFRETCWDGETLYFAKRWTKRLGDAHA